ncbi:hypothetical protein BJ878DRAFT_567179 [Calycina marina]|uniref:Uncharacterized protein n=1 Tax=Calycina marina TaxID=1763456 RepID=A0A9P7Z3Z6_9HELO|nr:hypothetical protein BJ878DRAFT_567179 [Calycina marina]
MPPPVHYLKSVVSSSFLYPFKGIYYFLTHPEFYPLCGRRIIPLVFISIVVLTLLFVFTYLPQVAFLAIFHGHLAWFNAVFLVLGEGQVAIALLFEALLVDETLVNVFDATLINEGLIDLVSPARILFPDAPNSVKMLGKPTTTAVYSPFSFRQIIEFILFLPLNLIPIFGSPAFLLITGARAGPLHHWRYFKLRGLSKKERNKEIKGRRVKYMWFGAMTLVLQLIPILSMFFLLTTAAGSALWVVSLEERKRVVLVADFPGQEEEGTVVVRGEGTADDDDAPPAYTDNPI